MNKDYLVDETGGRLDAFLSALEPDLTRGFIQKAIKTGRVTVDGHIVIKPSRPIAAGERITAHYPEEQTALIADPSSLEILYEDKYLLAVNKPAGMAVHPQSMEEQGSLVQSLISIRPEIKDAMYDPESPVSRLRPGIVHRLDKDTTGVILIAKTADVMQKLSDLFKNHEIAKEYVAILYGVIDDAETIDASLVRKPFRRNMMGIAKEEGTGRNAVTHIKPLKILTFKNGEKATVARCQIETGRTHQIRVHCKYIGHPVLGDATYSNKPAGKISIHMEVHRQMLHAEKVSFIHPITGKPLAIEAPLPDDMEALIAKSV